MDQHAIQRIEQLARGQDAIDWGKEPAVALPAGMELHDLEQFAPQPRRQRAIFETQRPSDFIDYTRPNSGTNTVAFVAADGSGAVAIMDFGTSETPGWKSNRAILSSKETPAYSALFSLTRRPVSQRDLVDWIEDWREIIDACDSNGEEIAMARAIAAIRRVTIKRGRESTATDADMSGSIETLDSVSAQGADDALPSFFRVETPMFEGLSNVEFRVRLVLRTSDDTPAFGLRIIALEQIKREVADEVETRIRDELPGIEIHVGEIATPGCK